MGVTVFVTFQSAHPLWTVEEPEVIKCNKELTSMTLGRIAKEELRKIGSFESLGGRY